jgi:hypothetical protein
MYTPSIIPLAIEKENPALAAWLRTELGSLERGLREPLTTMVLTPQYAAPKNPRAGTIVYADGTTWNPGSGQGVYRYTIAGAWVFVG